MVDLRLFKERNYAAGVTIMFFFGFVLYGSIMLLPLFLQTLMGYDATLAGWALAFGGIGSLMIMPVVGRLTMVMDSRKIVFVGLLINAYAVYLMSGYTTSIDYYHAWWPRFVQGFGLGATFVSLTTLTMSRISQEKMGNATGIFNLMRNLGGSFGIATATTLLARRSQFHQGRLVEHLTPLSQPFDDWQQRLSQALPDLGANWQWWNAPQAMAGLYQEVLRQAKMLAFCDDYWFFTIVFLCLLPLVFLMRHSPKPAVAPEEAGPRTPSLIRRTLVLCIQIRAIIRPAADLRRPRPRRIRRCASSISFSCSSPRFSSSGFSTRWGGIPWGIISGRWGGTGRCSCCLMGWSTGWKPGPGSISWSTRRPRPRWAASSGCVSGGKP